MNKFWIIVGQVYKKNVKSVGFITMMLSPIIMIGIIAAIIYFIGNSFDSVPTIAVISDSQEIQQLFQAEEEQFVVDESLSTLEDARTAVESEIIDAYLSVNTDNNHITADFVEVSGLDSVDLNYITSLLAAVQLDLQSQALGLSSDDMMALNTPPTINSSTVAVDDGNIIENDNIDEAIKTGAAYFICIAIFMFIMTYSSIIAEEIASEKGTRIMEIVLSSVSSTTHFFGKLTAIFLI